MLDLQGPQAGKALCFEGVRNSWLHPSQPAAPCARLWQRSLVGTLWARVSLQEGGVLRVKSLCTLECYPHLRPKCIITPRKARVPAICVFGHLSGIEAECWACRLIVVTMSSPPKCSTCRAHRQGRHYVFKGFGTLGCIHHNLRRLAQDCGRGAWSGHFGLASCCRRAGCCE